MSDSEIIKEFLVESYENLDRLDQDLIALEKDPANREMLASVFRTIHTIKGTSGFLAFNQLESLTHAGEGLLSRLRDGLLRLTPEITTALLSMVDAVRQMLASIENSGNEGPRKDQELIATLSALLEAKPGSTEMRKETGEENSNREPNSAQGKRVPLGDILVNDGKAKPSDVDAALEQQNAGDPRHVGEILVEKGVVKAQTQRSRERDSALLISN